MAQADAKAAVGDGNGTLGPTAPRASRALIACLALVLLVSTVAVYAQVRRYSFIEYDDNYYVTANPMVQRGVTAAGVRWAFTTVIDANWHPLAWLTHMACCGLFGVEPGAHHLVSVGFHAANVLVLFAAFVMMTRRPWPSAFVAGVFALHPLHVQSVAWIAPLNDLVSTFLGLVALLFYIRYTANRSLRALAPVVAFYTLALMARSMLMTFPFVLLLLDVWPLRRLALPPGLSALKPLVVEKIPLFILAGASCAATIAARHAAGSVRSLAEVPLLPRIAAAGVGYLSYVEKAFVPRDFGLLYPLHPVSHAQAAAAVAVLIAVTAVAVLLARGRPYLLVGWLWFLGMLVPVIGIVQNRRTGDRRPLYLPAARGALHRGRVARG